MFYYDIIFHTGTDQSTNVWLCPLFPPKELNGYEGGFSLHWATSYTRKQAFCLHWRVLLPPQPAVPTCLPPHPTPVQKRRACVTNSPSSKGPPLAFSCPHSISCCSRITSTKYWKQEEMKLRTRTPVALVGECWAKIYRLVLSNNIHLPSECSKGKQPSKQGSFPLFSPLKVAGRSLFLLQVGVHGLEISPLRAN